MQKISFDNFEKIMAYDVMQYTACIEIEFVVEDSPKYTSCWLGKTCAVGGVKLSKESYWYGLLPDASQAYDFDSFDDFISAPIFDGKNIHEIWDSIVIYTIDGCDTEYRLPYYLGT